MHIRARAAVMAAAVAIAVAALGTASVAAAGQSPVDRRRGRGDAAGVRLRGRDPRARVGRSRLRHRPGRCERQDRPRHHAPGGHRDRATRCPVIMDASPYYTTLGRGQRVRAHRRHRRRRHASTSGRSSTTTTSCRAATPSCSCTWSGTANSTGCPVTGGTPDNLSAKVGIDWLNGRVPGLRRGRQRGHAPTGTTARPA